VKNYINSFNREVREAAEVSMDSPTVSSVNETSAEDVYGLFLETTGILNVKDCDILIILGHPRISVKQSWKDQLPYDL
jgi:hypothetical protein